MPTAQIAAPMTLADEELAQRHLARAREHRDDRAHERDEAREHDRARSALVEEHLRPFEVLDLEETGVGLEQPRAEPAPDPVSELRARDRGDERTDHDHREVEVRVARVGARRAEGAREEQDRVAGQRAGDQPGLHEHDQDQADRPERLDEILGAQPVHGGDHGGER